MSRQLGVMSGIGAAVFGDRFEVGRDVEQDHVDNIQGSLRPLLRRAATLIAGTRRVLWKTRKHFWANQALASCRCC
jgi:hypothetical protein